MKIKKLLAMLCCVTIPTVYAAGSSISITESSSDKLITKKYKDPDTGESSTEYSVATTGTFSATAKISADAFDEAGITWDELGADTKVSLTIGDFSFSSTLGETDKPALKKNTLTANWTNKEELCDDNDKCKSVITDKVNVSAANNGKGATFKITGNSKIDGDVSYGQVILAKQCAENGTGVLDGATATLTINDKPMSAQLTTKCTVKTTHVSKPDDDYELNSIKLTSKLAN